METISQKSETILTGISISWRAFLGFDLRNLFKIISYVTKLKRKGPIHILHLLFDDTWVFFILFHCFCNKTFPHKFNERTPVFIPIPPISYFIIMNNKLCRRKTLINFCFTWDEEVKLKFSKNLSMSEILFRIEFMLR